MVSSFTLIELKAAKDGIRGIRRCPECGAAIAEDANFCPSCGAKCEKPEPEVYEGEVVDVEEEAEESTETEAEDAPVDEEAFEDEEKTEE